MLTRSYLATGRMLAVIVLAMGALVCPQIGQADQTEEMTEVINRFVTHVNQLDQVSAELKTQAVTTIEAMRDDEYNREFAITEGLALIYPEYGKALETMAGDDPASAEPLLNRLAESTDKFLAGDAMFYLARTYAFQERFENALPLLEKLMDEYSDQTVQVGTALYLKGVVQSGMLKRKESKKTLQKFLEDYPNASERMRIGAWRRLQELHVIEDGTMHDVYERMDFSRRRLQLEESDDVTQTEQDKVVEILTSLIKKVEDQEKQNCKNCKDGNQQQQENQQGQNGKGEGQNKGQQGGNSQNPDGVVRRTFGTGPTSPWSKLRDRSRDPALSKLKDKYPARYQKMIEQYYKSFQTEGGR